MVKKIVFVSAGVSLGLIFAFRMLEGTLKSSSQIGRGSVTTELAPAVTSQTLRGGATEYTVSVRYHGFVMTQITGESQEYLTLPTPVFLQDVMSKIGKIHIALAPMLPQMSVVINGIPIANNVQLTDNAQIDLIPLYAGG